MKVHLLCTQCCWLLTVLSWTDASIFQYACKPNGDISAINVDAKSYHSAFSYNKVGSCTTELFRDYTVLKITKCPMGNVNNSVNIIFSKTRQDYPLVSGMETVSKHAECSFKSKGIQSLVEMEFKVRGLLRHLGGFPDGFYRREPTMSVDIYDVTGEPGYNVFSISYPINVVITGPPEADILPEVCTAYSSRQLDTGLSRTLLINGCSLSSGLMFNFTKEKLDWFERNITEFDPARFVLEPGMYNDVMMGEEEEDEPLPPPPTIFTHAHAFRFYLSNYVRVECEVRICPEESDNCALPCDTPEDNRNVYPNETTSIPIGVHNMLRKRSINTDDEIDNPFVIGGNPESSPEYVSWIIPMDDTQNDILVPNEEFTPSDEELHQLKDLTSVQDSGFDSKPPNDDVRPDLITEGEDTERISIGSDGIDDRKQREVERMPDSVTIETASHDFENASDVPEGQSEMESVTHDQINNQDSANNLDDVIGRPGSTGRIGASQNTSDVTNSVQPGEDELSEIESIMPYFLNTLDSANDLKDVISKHGGTRIIRIGATLKVLSNDRFAPSSKSEQMNEIKALPQLDINSESPNVDQSIDSLDDAIIKSFPQSYINSESASIDSPIDEVIPEPEPIVIEQDSVKDILQDTITDTGVTSNNGETAFDITESMTDQGIASLFDEMIPEPEPIVIGQDSLTSNIWLEAIIHEPNLDITESDADQGIDLFVDEIIPESESIVIEEDSVGKDIWLEANFVPHASSIIGEAVFDVTDDLNIPKAEFDGTYPDESAKENVDKFLESYIYKGYENVNLLRKLILNNIPVEASIVDSDGHNDINKHDNYPNANTKENVHVDELESNVDNRHGNGNALRKLIFNSTPIEAGSIELDEEGRHENTDVLEYILAIISASDKYDADKKESEVHEPQNSKNSLILDIMGVSSNVPEDETMV